MAAQVDRQVPIHQPREISPYRQYIDTAAKAITEIWHSIYYSMLVSIPRIVYKVAFVRAYENPEGWERVKAAWNRVFSGNPAQANENLHEFVETTRVFIQDPVEDITDPEIGMDPLINSQHLQVPIYLEAEIPEAPDEDIAQLPALFDQFVQRDHPDLIDDDTPGTFEEYRAGIDTLVRIIREEKFYCLNNSGAPNLLRHICSLLRQQQPGIGNDTKAACLIELAKGGHRECPTRIMEGSLAAYQTLSGNLQALNIPQQIGKILHDARLGIFREKSRLHPHPEDIQVYQEYIITLRDYLGLSRSIPTYNDHLDLSFELTPKKSLPDFFQTYDTQFIIDLVTNALNGHPIENRPAHERAAKQIPTGPAYQWFTENPLLSGADPLDPVTNTFSFEAVLHLLINLEILDESLLQDQ